LCKNPYCGGARLVQANPPLFHRLGLLPPLSPEYFFSGQLVNPGTLVFDLRIQVTTPTTNLEIGFFPPFVFPLSLPFSPVSETQNFRLNITLSCFLYTVMPLSYLRCPPSPDLLLVFFSVPRPDFHWCSAPPQMLSLLPASLLQARSVPLCYDDYPHDAAALSCV